MAGSRRVTAFPLKLSMQGWGDLPVDAGYRLLAARYVRKQAKQLRAQFDGICAAEDIEFVHRARVASRRLRAAMRIFGKCFKRKQVKRWKKAIRRIRSELGEARDKDVQIELLRGILDSLTDKKCFAGISRLLVQWEYERERLQSNVVRAVKRLQRKGALKDLENAAQTPAFKSRGARNPGAKPRKLRPGPARDTRPDEPVAGIAGLSWPARRSAEPSCHADCSQAFALYLGDHSAYL